jgi:hypothetical protein
MLRFLRRIGIAIGSLTIAYLAIALVGGIIGLSPAVGILAVIVLGALIYRDIVSRETSAS